MGPRLNVVLAALVLLSPAFITDTEEAAGAAVDPVQQAVQQAAQQAADVLSCGAQRGHAANKQPCASLGAALPSRLAELMTSSKIPDEFRLSAAQGNLSSVTPGHLADMPLTVLLHISAEYLSTCNPRALSAVVRRHASDTVIARKVIAALEFVPDDQRIKFIRELGTNSGMSAEVQEVIGAAAARWWAKDMKAHSVDLATVGTPLLAALPPGYLAELPDDLAANMLMRLRNYPWESPNDPRWSSQPLIIRRVWMELFKKDAASGKAQLITDASEGLNMLWAGATPEEINDLQFEDEDRSSLLKLRQLTKMQARAFLTKLYPRSALSSVEFNEVFDWMLDLSPAGLQRFLVNDTDFSSLPSADISQASVPTLKQVLEEVVASDVVQGRIVDPTKPGTWGRSLKDIGRLAYLIRPALLSDFSGQPLPLDVLAAVDTYKLTALQARYLTNNGKFVDLRRPLKDLEGLHGLTRSIPTGRLAELRESVINNDVMHHLLESLPATHPGRSAVIFNKKRTSLVEPRVLEAVLRNPKPAQYFDLISARELSADRANLEKTFSTLKAPPRMRSGLLTLGDFVNSHLNKKDNIEGHLTLVPERSLAALLGSARRDLSESKSIVWTSDTLLSSDRPLVRGALLGLTCSDVHAMDLVDFPVIMAAFNKRVREAGIFFPKRLQHCLQRAMEDYLAMKKVIRRYREDVPLIAVLETSDIEAFGGYLLSTLHAAHIRQSQHAILILETIGSLTAPELLAAVHIRERLQEFALDLVDLHSARGSLGPRCLFALGTLHMFLPADVIAAVQPAAWKLFVEAHAGDAHSLTVCADNEQRDAWQRLHVRAFGSPASWSAGVVAALGDALAALPADELAKVRTVSWRDAADTLSARTVYHLGTDVPGSDHGLAFVDVCRAVMESSQQSTYYWSVRRVVRYYLRAAQGLLDTVEHADQLVRRLQQRSASHRFRQDYHSHGRHSSHGGSALSTTSTTTEEPSTTTTEEPSMSTTTTEAVSTPGLLDDFDGFFDNTPKWLMEATSTTEAPTSTTETPEPASYPPRTVIVRPDAPGEHADDVTSTTDSTSTTLGTAKDTDEILKDWDEAADSLAVFNSASASEAVISTEPTTTASALPESETAPSALLSLPSLFNNSETPSLDQSEVQRNDTTKFSSLDDQQTAPQDDNNTIATNLVRRRRGDRNDEESEKQIARDVRLQVSCDALHSLGAAASLALVRSDADQMMDDQIVDCAEMLGALYLKRDTTVSFWNKIPQVQRIDMVGDLGRLVSAISLEEVPLLNVSLANERGLDTISVVAEHVLDIEVLDAVATQVVTQNPGLSALAGGGWSAVDADSLLVALGPLTCSLPLELQRLLLARRGALQHAARSLQGVRFHCNETCLEELARAAVSDAALGKLESWTAEDVRDMGVIIAGLNATELRQLHRPQTSVEQPISGLAASAVACMRPDQVQAIGDLLSVLTPMAAEAVTPQQRQDLSVGQEAALVRVRNLAFTRVLGRGQSWGGSGKPTSGGNILARPLGTVLCVLVPYLYVTRFLG